MGIERAFRSFPNDKIAELFKGAQKARGEPWDQGARGHWRRYVV